MLLLNRGLYMSHDCYENVLGQESTIKVVKSLHI